MNKLKIMVGAVWLAVFCATLMCVADETPSPARPLKGKMQLSLLKPGAVKPTGWLRDCAIAMKDGYTGRSHEYHEDFRKAWTLDKPSHFYPYECGAYWLDGLARLAYQLDDAELLALMKERVEPVLSGMHENAILFYYFMNRTNAVDVAEFNKNAFFIRAAGQYARGLWAYYQASDDSRALRAFQHAYSGDRTWLQGHASIKGISAVMEAYRLCGTEKTAAMFDMLYDRNQVRNPRVPWHDYLLPPGTNELAFLNRPASWEHWHGVMMCETLGSLAYGSLWTGDAHYLEKSLAWRDRINEICEQITGSVVCDEHLARPGAYRGTETCVVAGQLWDDLIFLSLSGDGRFADHAEKLSFNTAPICTTRDARKHVYFQAPNRVASGDCGNFVDGPKKSGGIYKREHFPRCCMASLNRLLPLQIQSLWMARENGIAAVLYGPCTLETELSGAGKVHIEEKTAYPFEETIRLEVQTEKPAEFPIWLRIPAWCREPSIKINGKIVADAPHKGFVKIVRKWRTGDDVALVFPQEVSVVEGVDIHSGGARFAGVMLGPLVMALNVEGDDENTHRADAPWQFALDEKSFSATVMRSAVKPGFNWPADAPVKVTASLVGGTWKHDAKNPRLPKQDEISLGEDQTLTLVPYACSRMRVTLFPAVDRSVGEKEFKTVEIPSSADGTVQKANFLSASKIGKPQPLLVSLHPWSGGYDMPEYMAKEILSSGWNYIRPDFRGYNNRPDACLSAKALSDIDDAIAYAIANGNVDTNRIAVCGVSGGGMATLGVYRRSRFPLAVCVAWVPISDLGAWYRESVALKTKYAAEIEKATSSAPGWLNEAEAHARSPLYMEGPIALRGTLEIYAGINDGHLPGVVPISQSIRFYNTLADQYGHAGAKVSDEEAKKLLARDTDDLKPVRRLQGRDVLFSRGFPGVSLNVFAGGHEMLGSYSFTRIAELLEK